MLTAAQNFTAAILTVQSVSRAIAVLHSPCAAKCPPMWRPRHCFQLVRCPVVPAAEIFAARAPFTFILATDMARTCVVCVTPGADGLLEAVDQLRKRNAGATKSLSAPQPDTTIGSLERPSPFGFGTFCGGQSFFFNVRRAPRFCTPITNARSRPPSWPHPTA